MKEATTNGPFLLPNSIYFSLPISLPTYIPTCPHLLSTCDPHTHIHMNAFQYTHMHNIDIYACISKCIGVSLNVATWLKLERVTRKVKQCSIARCLVKSVLKMFVDLLNTTKLLYYVLLSNPNINNSLRNNFLIIHT